MATDWPEARELAAAAIVPTGTDRYIALFEGNPIAGGLELTLAGYARVAFQDWSTASSPGESARSNASPIVFPTITDAGVADFWAIYDTAGPGGVLLRSSTVNNVIDEPTPIIFTGAGQEARMPIGALVLLFPEV